MSLVTRTPQQVAESMLGIDTGDRDIKMILFPTVIKEENHCVLLVAFPEDRDMLLYDSRGPESSKRLSEKLPWLKDTGLNREKKSWRLTWCDCPEQSEADACGVFMLMNARFVAEDQGPDEAYSQNDALFLRRYIAASICMGDLPD